MDVVLSNCLHFLRQFPFLQKNIHGMKKKLCLFDSVPIFFWFKFDTISPCLYKEPSADSYLRFLSGMLNVFCFFFRDFRLRDGFRP